MNNINRKTGEEVSEFGTIGTYSDQIEHQSAMTNHPSVIIDPDNYDGMPSVVEMDGSIVVPADEERIRQLTKEDLSPENIVTTIKENSHEALLRLLAIQDNKHPLKRGGIGIAYRTDALIRYCKMEWTAEENVVFDAITGMVSSYPENKSYRISPADFKEFVSYSNDKSLYNAFKKGADGLEKRRLVFDGIGPEGNDTITIAWNEICHYHRASKKKGELAYIEFVPTEFFKDLLLCSGIVHGAHYKLKVVTQLRGKYTNALYYFLEDFKNYTAYKGAKPGLFEVSLEELRYQLSIPETYTVADIKRRILDPTKESINNCEDCDFIFDYQKVPKTGVTKGFLFVIEKKQYIEEKKEIEETETIDEFENQVLTLLALSSNKYTDAEKKHIIIECRENGRDINFLIQAIAKLNDKMSMENVAEPARYLIKIVRNGLVTTPESRPDREVRKKNSFANFDERTYDYDELMEDLKNSSNK